MNGDTVDPLVFGQRVRHYRRQRGLTLDDLGSRVDKPGPFLSLLENGKREPRLSLINELARALEVPAVELLKPEAPTHRAELEIGLERAQEHTLYRELGLPHLRATAKLSDAAMEHILGLFGELKGRAMPAMVTREEARIANSELRAEMKSRDNYFAEVETVARDAVAGVGYAGHAALTEGDIEALAAHMGFSVVRAQDVPSSARSVTDLRNRRIYVPQRDALSTRAARSVVMQTLGRLLDTLTLEPVSNGREIVVVRDVVDTSWLVLPFGVQRGGYVLQAVLISSAVADQHDVFESVCA